MNFLVEMLTRIQTETPRFFIILRWMFGVLAVIAFMVQKVITDQVWQPAHADKVTIIAGYFITAALTVWGTSFLPTKSANEKAT